MKLKETLTNFRGNLGFKGQLKVRKEKIRVDMLKYQNFNLTREDLQLLLIDNQVRYEQKNNVLKMISITFFMTSMGVIFSFSSHIIENFMSLFHQTTVSSDKMNLIWMVLILFCFLISQSVFLFLWIIYSLKDIRFLKKEALILQYLLKQK